MPAEDDKYDVLEKIGHGSFGIIRKVRRKEDGLILCRKEISYSKMSAKEREQLQAELSILKELRHPHIVAYYERDHIKTTQDLHLYMEYCGNGDLGKIIREHKESKKLIDEEFVWTVLAQIVSALYRCHYGLMPPEPGSNVLGLGPDAKPQPRTGKPMILHRDLKPENIFLGENNSVKLGDFGLSKILQSHDFASTYVGTPFYMSPEICKAETYTLYSDIWALGCIIYEMCVRQPPFNAKTHFELIQKIKLGRYPPIPSSYSPELAKVIAQCLQVTPEYRPDTAKLLNLPAVKMMRKEQEVVELNQRLIKERGEVAALRQQLERKMAGLEPEMEKMRQELDSSLRREWEVKARLEIDRQVKNLMAAETAKLQAQFETEVNARIEKTLSKYPARLSTSPRLAPRSNTPTMPTEQGDLFPTAAAALKPIVVNGGGSTSTLGTESSFATGTDLSALSLDDSPEEPAAAQKPTVACVIKRSSRRAPLTRAQTVAAAQLPPPSPMDVHMADPSPAPAPPSLAGLSLSPRRPNAPRTNIFAAAKDAAKRAERWQPEVPGTPTSEEWDGDLGADDDDDDDIHTTPTRARSASNGSNNRSGNTNTRSGNVSNKSGGQLNIKNLPVLKPSQRLGSAPNLVAKGVAARVQPRPTSSSTVPIVAASPARTKNIKATFELASANASPSRRDRTNLTSKVASASSKTSAPDSSATATSGLRSKKGALDRAAAATGKRNLNTGTGLGVRGRTLVELQQARGIPVATGSYSDDDVTTRLKLRSPMRPRSGLAGGSAPAVWDPEKEEEMPSPFIVRSRLVPARTGAA